MTNIKERVLLITDFKGVAKEKFFKDLAVSYASFKGKAKNMSLSSDVLVSLLTKYPEISSLWLLTGKGEMLVSESESKNVSKKIIKSEKTEFEEENKELTKEVRELNKEIRELNNYSKELNKEIRELNTEVKGLNNEIIFLTTGESKRVG